MLFARWFRVTLWLALCLATCLAVQPSLVP